MERNIPQRHDGLTEQPGQASSARIDLKKTSYRQQAKRARAAMSMAERMRQSEAVCDRLLRLPEVGAARVVACYLAHGDELDLGSFMRAFVVSNDRLEGAADGNGGGITPGEHEQRESLGKHEQRENSGEHELLDGCEKSPIEPEFSQVPATPETAGISQNPDRIVALPVTLRGPKLAFVQVNDAELANPEMLPRCLREPSRALEAVPAELAGRVIDPADIDIAILPGLAFDTHGTRLGYGGGYYDAWLGEAYGLGGADKTEKRSGGARRSTSKAPSSQRPFLIGACFDCQLLPLAATLPREPHDIAMDVVVIASRVLQLN